MLANKGAGVLGTGVIVKDWQRGLISAVVGIFVFLLVFPFSGIDTDPPVHYSVFGHEVPSDNPLLAFGCALATGGIIWVIGGRGRSSGNKDERDGV